MLRDIVDWPHTSINEDGKISLGEDDSFVYTDYNVVVNAFHYIAVKTLAKIASEIGATNDAIRYKEYVRDFIDVFNSSFLNRKDSLYVDGVGVSHSSLHANMFPLAFGVVPEEYKPAITRYIISRGMACSVYGAQFLLEALFNACEADLAIRYLTSESDRSWMNMLREGATITMEAWGNSVKKDQDWIHAWGTAPANIIQFRLIGIKPISPGFDSIEIRPQIGTLKEVHAAVPSPKGQIIVDIKCDKFIFEVPSTISADVYIPQPSYEYSVLMNGKEVDIEIKDGFIHLLERICGKMIIDIIHL